MALAVAAVLLPAVAACGPRASSGTGDTSPSPQAGLSNVDTSPSAATPSPSTSPILADGRSPVYLTGIDVSGRSVTFDLIEFLTGDAAKKAWQKDNPGSGQDGPDNDYYIVNDNPKLRTLPVAATVSVNVLDMTSGAGTDTKQISFADLPAYLAELKPDDRRLSYNPFWLTVQNGQIVKIEEQFIP